MTFHGCFGFFLLATVLGVATHATAQSAHDLHADRIADKLWWIIGITKQYQPQFQAHVTLEAPDGDRAGGVSESSMGAKRSVRLGNSTGSRNEDERPQSEITRVHGRQQGSGRAQTTVTIPQDGRCPSLTYPADVAHLSKRIATRCLPAGPTGLTSRFTWLCFADV